MATSLNDHDIVLQLARGTEALAMAERLSAIVELADDERKKAHERFKLDRDAINDRYLGMVLEAVREFNNRVNLLDVDDDNANYDDD
jgi:hypothetical protein